MLLSCRDIDKAFGERTILNKINFLINEKEKAAIVGVNGAGKTTLFKIITGELHQDSGEIIVKQGISLGYMSQLPVLNDENTVYQEMETVFLHVIEMENKLRDMEEKMAHAAGDELETLMEQYSRLTHEFEHINGYEYKSRIRGVITGLGFCDEDSSQQVGTFSGGQKTRLSLAKLLLTEPDLLLLDEPTNHLDIEAIEWLEDFLRNYAKAVLIISHDRYFMDKIVTKVIEIEHGNADCYEGNYTDFAGKKEAQREILRKHYENQQKEIKRQEEVIRVLKSYNREKSVKRAESREKQLDKMEKIKKPDSLPSSMRIALSPKRESGNDVLNISKVSKFFDGEKLFENISFEVFKGDKIALIGPNGVGKTTLLRIIMDTVKADSGEVRFGSHVCIGYYDQEHKNINPAKTLFDEISDSFPKLSVLDIRNALAAFLFAGDDVFKQISTLSGGEKGRVALAKIMLGDANFLILDEPTNHLDINSQGILEEVLRNYEGTILYISHDRYFINNTATKVIELSKNNASLFLGDYDYYLEKKKEFAINEEIRAEKKESEVKEKWTKGKEEIQKKRKIKSVIAQTEKEIKKQEERLKEIDDALLLPEINSNHEALTELFEEKTELENSLLLLYETWEEATVQTVD